MTGVTLGGTTGGLTSAAVQAMLSVTAGPIAADPSDTHNLAWTFNSTRRRSISWPADRNADADLHGAGDRRRPWPFDDQTVTITITGTNDAPVITASATVTFTGGTAVVLDAGLKVTDVDSGDLTVSSVRISAGFLGGDTLNFINANGITGTYAAGLLTLSGMATVAQSQAAFGIDHLQFQPDQWRSDQRRHRQRPHHHLGGDRRQCDQRLEHAGDQHAYGGR